MVCICSLLLSQDLRKEFEKATDLKALISKIKKDLKKATFGGESTGSGASKTTEVKPVSNIAVKGNAEEADSSSKKMAGGKETAAAANCQLI